MKTLILNYTFDKTAKTVTFSDYVTIRLDSILLITNVTSNVIIYNFADATKGGTVATNVLTLTYNTSAMANTDKLQIFYDDAAATQAITASALPLPTGAATSGKQDTGNTSLASIDSKVSDVATQTTLALIKAKTDNLDTALSGIKTGTDKIPASPATAGNQTTANTSLATIATNTGNIPASPATAGNQTTANTSLLSIDTNAGTTSDALVAAGATGSIAAKLRRVTQGLEDLKSLLVLAAGTNTIGGVIPKPTTAGGYLVYRNLDMQSTGVLILTGTRQVYGWYIANNASSVRYVKLYNKATAPTVGTDTPTHTIAIPANSATNIDFSIGIPFSLGLGIGGVTGVADNNTGAPTANDLIINLNYF